MDEAGWLEELKAKPWLVTAGLLGVFLTLVGVVSAGMIADRMVGKNGVEIVELDEEQEEEGGGLVVVDVGGAVMEPGVYELESGARVNDVLIKAGGLSLEANRDWVSKNLNLAQELSDGVKLYVPFESEENIGGEVGGEVMGSQVGEKINVNVASISELDSLWGVGEVTAKKIVENRPYSSVEELLSKKVLKSNVYEEIKDEIRVF